MDCCDGANVPEICRESKSCPCAPAKASSEDTFNTFALEMISKLFVVSFNVLIFLFLKGLHKFGHILNSTSVYWVQKLWDIDIEPELSIGISYGFMFSGIDAKNILEEDEAFASRTTMVYLRASKIDCIALGFIGDL